MPDDVAFIFERDDRPSREDFLIHIRLKNTKGLKNPSIDVAISPEYKKLLTDVVRNKYNTGIYWNDGRSIWFSDIKK